MSHMASLPLSGRRLEGKVAIVTGGAMGIGEVTAKLFCLHGAKVVIVDIQDELAKTVCTNIGSEDIISFIHCDVTKEEDVKKAVDFTVAKYGRLDIMINNAAIIENPCSRIMDFDVSEFERAISVNCTGVFLCMKHAARVMVEAGIKGSIINYGSVCTVVGGLAPHGYVAAKHAVVGLTKNGAAELGQYGVRVNCISMFASASPMATGFSGLKVQNIGAGIAKIANLKGAVLKHEDTAQAAVFFASDESKYVSGHNFVIDGGFTIVNNAFGIFKQNASFDHFKQDE